MTTALLDGPAPSGAPLTVPVTAPGDGDGDADGNETRRSPLSGPSILIAAGTAWLIWVAVSALSRAGTLWSTLASGRAELVAPVVLAVVVVLVVCERIWPAEQRGALASGHLHDACFFVLHVAAIVPLLTLMGVAFGHLFGGIGRWIGPSWDAAVPRWAILVGALVLMDGCNWIAHWADHRVSALWRLHALHHTQEEVSVLTSFRAHPLSHWAGFALSTLPVVVLLGDGSMLPTLITGYICLSTLSHANVPWTFGWFGRIFVSPAYHRLHHAAERSSPVNLGVVFTVWDVVARRAVFPQPGDPAYRTGLVGRPFATEQSVGAPSHLRLLVRQLLEPFGRAPSAAPTPTMTTTQPPHGRADPFQIAGGRPAGPGQHP